MVRAKKYLGQHFLNDRDLASRIAGLLSGFGDYTHVLEIGPGTGVLTKYLAELDFSVSAIEVDSESVDYLKRHKVAESVEIIQADFLKSDLEFLEKNKWAIIGNFPYNISSQLFFRLLDFRNQVCEIVCMLQHEVAERLASPPGSKKYGILSVLLQAFYTIQYIEKVPPDVFIPPPKVDSGVIRLQRNDTSSLACDEQLFRKIVKQGFQNRRKTLRNALKPLNLDGKLTTLPQFSKRAEQLSVDDFVQLALLIQDGSPDKI